MRSIVFEGDTWNMYEVLRLKNKILHKSLCRILKEMQRGDPAVGIGKPEALKHNLSGLWSRKLTKENRLIYSFDEKYINIFAIGGHYDKK
jgi:toxin YoeB